ncbi:MAG: hypothetical protein WCG23_04275 [bacterium]
MVQGINAVKFNREQFIQKLQAAGISQEELQTARSQGPSAFEELLKSHGIQAPPPPPNNDANQDQFVQKLKALGVPDDIIKQGPQAVMKYAQEHNIQLPELPQRTHGDHHGNHKAEFQAKVEEYRQQHPNVSEQEAEQAVIAEFKARQTAQEIKNQSK